MTGRTGNPVPNQFEITVDGFTYFQSYNTVIAQRNDFTGKVFLDSSAWDHSCTTGKYRNVFLGEKKSDTEKKIKSNEYGLKNLNR